MEFWRIKSLENLSLIKDGIEIVEEWADIPNYEGLYKVSSFGRIKALERTLSRKALSNFKGGNTQKRSAKIITQFISNTKRLMVTLCKNNVPKQYQSSRLVALSFIPNPLNKEQVNHINGKYQQNYKRNLEWNTARENADHAVKNGLAARGKRNKWCKLSESDVLSIFNSPLKLKELAVIYGVDYTTCGYIKSGKKWSWLTGKIYKRTRKIYNKINENGLKTPTKKP